MPRACRERKLTGDAGLESGSPRANGPRHGSRPLTRRPLALTSSVKYYLIMALSETQKAARVLGRAGGMKGGKARAAKLSPERRKEIAQNAIAARWAKAKTKTIEQLISEQGIHPVADVGVFAGSIPDEDVDEFVADIYRDRLA